MYIRDLQSRVQFLRQDLPVGFVSMALQDAARLVARKTGIVRKIVYGVVTEGTVKVDLRAFMGAVAGEFDVLRPTKVMYCPGLDRAASFISLTSAVVGNIALATVATPFSFYIADAAITLSDGVTSYPLREGDVLCAVNGVWTATPYYKYRIARDVSKPRLLGAQQAPLNSVGYFANFITDRDALFLSPIPVNDVAVQIECSIVPLKEFDNVEFPVDAEDAIIAAAKAQIYGTPNKTGGGADLGTAKHFQAMAEGEISLVRSIAEGGYGDTEMPPPPRFGA